LLAGDPFDRPTGWPHEPDSIPSPHGSGPWSSGCRPDCTRINLEPLGRDTLRAAEAVTGTTIRRSAFRSRWTRTLPRGSSVPKSARVALVGRPLLVRTCHRSPGLRLGWHQERGTTMLESARGLELRDSLYSQRVVSQKT
jgi:hypothetical protein